MVEKMYVYRRAVPGQGTKGKHWGRGDIKPFRLSLVDAPMVQGLAGLVSTGVAHFNFHVMGLCVGFIS